MLFRSSIVDILMKSAAQMIAQYIAIGIARSFAGVGGLFQGAGPVQFPGSTSVNPTAAFGLPNLMKRAGGGSVTAGQPYLVGERGPELFMPGRSGGIAPTSSFGGGVQVGSVNITVQNTGENLSPAAQKQIANQVQGIVMSTLVNQKRSGGIL